MRKLLALLLLLAAPNAIAQQHVGWNVSKIGGPKELGPYPVWIGVADTGLDKSNKDLNVGRGRNFVSGRGATKKDSVGSAWDCNGHGTGVAGIVAANGSMLGVVPGAELFSARVVDCSGSALDSDVVDMLQWVLDNAPRPAVLNLSFRQPADERQGALFRQLAASQVFVAIGNGESALDSPEINCNFRLNKFAIEIAGMMSVGGSNEDDTEWGLNDAGCVEVWAPASPSYLTTKLGGGLRSFCCNSGATPHVAAAAALILSHEPWLTPAEVEIRIRVNAVVTGVLAKDGVTPFARLDISRF